MMCCGSHFFYNSITTSGAPRHVLKMSDMIYTEELVHRIFEVYEVETYILYDISFWMKGFCPQIKKNRAGNMPPSTPSFRVDETMYVMMNETKRTKRTFRDNFRVNLTAETI